MRLKFVATIFFLLLILKGYPTSTIPCTKTLTEFFINLNVTGTIFTCKILYTDNNAGTYLTTQTALVNEVFFGSIDSDTITISSQGYNDSYVYPSGGGPKDTVIRTYEIGDNQKLIYTWGDGHKFGYGRICAAHSKSINNSPEVVNELNMLRQFSSIVKNKKTEYFIFYNSAKKIVAEGNFKNGVAVGLWKNYYDDGKISISSPVEDGSLRMRKQSVIDTFLNLKSEIDFEHHFTKEYYPNGFIQNYTLTKKHKVLYIGYSQSSKGIPEYKEINIKHDTIDFLTDYWYFGNGKPHTISTRKEVWRRGTPVSQGGYGKYQEFYENGNLKLVGILEKDRRIGVWKWYYENGIFNAKFDYKDGKGTQ